MENMSCLYTTLKQVLSQYSNWLDPHYLKTLAGIMVGLMYLGLMKLSAWAHYLVSPAQL